jgi:NAD+ synthase
VINSSTLNAHKISEWIKNYAENSNIHSLVIGVSGGIDSALVSTLCCMTGLKTYAVSLPIKQQSKQYDRANQHINWLKTNFDNVSSCEVNLTGTFEMIEKSLQTFSNDLSSANTRSRLRMTALYHIATSVRGLVVGTGNKVEDFGVGFFTKYGDGGVDISPIGDLTKTEVRIMASELGIVESILIAKPTDGLWEDDRSDEDQIGATYEELEWAMNYLETNSNKILSERQKTVMNIYINFHRKNLHKMNPIPVFTHEKI